MTKEKQLRGLGMAASDIRSVLADFDPQSNIHQALSVANEQIEWVIGKLAKEQPVLLQVIDGKSLSSGEKDLPESPMICGYLFQGDWGKEIYCHLIEGHEGSHVGQ